MKIRYRTLLLGTAAAAAAGRASSTVWTARSSWAEDRNHAS